MNPLANTRTLEAEHSYPTPTRNLLSMHNREAAKRKMGRATQAGELRCGYRATDGTNYLFPTESELAQAREHDRMNKVLERQQRQAALMQKLNDSMARIDSWASKA